MTNKYTWEEQKKIVKDYSKLIRKKTMTDKPNKTSLKPNKWVKENGKWVEYKCVKSYSDNKEYMSALNSSKILDNINLQYLINTLEDLLDMRNKNDNR